MKKMVYHSGLRLAARFKSGGPSLGRSPGAHKQRRPVNQDKIQSFGEIKGRHISRAGTRPALFLWSVSRVLPERACCYGLWPVSLRVALAACSCFSNTDRKPNLKAAE